MRRLWLRGQALCVVLVAVLALVGCRALEIQPLQFQDAPWRAGEVSIYQLADLNGNYAGTARYDLARLTDEMWNLRREINAQGTQEIVVVDVRDAGLRPVESTLIRMMSDGTELVHTKYDGSQANLELTTKLNITTQQRISIPSDVREHATVVMLLRALPLAEGYAARMNVFWPVVGTVERVTVEVVGREEVSTLVASYDTWHVRLTMPDNSTIEAWIGTEAPYPVVKFVDSRNGGTFELSDFQPGE